MTELAWNFMKWHPVLQLQVYLL